MRGDKVLVLRVRDCQRVLDLSCHLLSPLVHQPTLFFHDESVLGSYFASWQLYFFSSANAVIQ